MLPPICVADGGSKPLSAQYREAVLRSVPSLRVSSPAWLRVILSSAKRAFNFMYFLFPVYSSSVPSSPLPIETSGISFILTLKS
jgi:hypothetical protein